MTLLLLVVRRFQTQSSGSVVCAGFFTDGPNGVITDVGRIQTQPNGSAVRAGFCTDRPNGVILLGVDVVLHLVIRFVGAVVPVGALLLGVDVILLLLLVRSPVVVAARSDGPNGVGLAAGGFAAGGLAPAGDRTNDGLAALEPAVFNTI